MDAIPQTTIQVKSLHDRYQIFEGENGLQISESRVLLFDVMAAHDEGDSIYEISRTFNLTPLQVQTAVDYIERHRTALEPEFAKAIQRREERREYYDKLAEEHWQRIRERHNPTPLQKAAYELLDKHRAQIEDEIHATHSQ